MHSIDLKFRNRLHGLFLILVAFFIIFCISPTSAKDLTADQNLITSTSIGKAKIGMTIGELKQAYPQAKFHLIFVTPKNKKNVDVELRQSGSHLMRVSYQSKSENCDANHQIQKLCMNETVYYITTKNPKFKTADGIRVGSPLEKIEKSYGGLMIDVGHDDISEVASSAKHPTKDRLMFMVAPPKGHKFAGLYESLLYGDPPNEHEQATKFLPGSKVKEILVPGSW
jgi:hypothetical protein